MLHSDCCKADIRCFLGRRFSIFHFEVFSFKFSPESGVLDREQSTEIEVEFTPVSIGDFQIPFMWALEVWFNSQAT